MRRRMVLVMSAAFFLLSGAGWYLSEQSAIKANAEAEHAADLKRQDREFEAMMRKNALDQELLDVKARQLGFKTKRDL